MNNQMTPWYPSHIKPVRAGVYEVKFVAGTIGKLFAMWDGCKWSNATVSLNCAMWAEFQHAEQDKIWRGFTQEQK